MNRTKIAVIVGTVFALALGSVAHAQLNLANTGVDISPSDGFDDNYLYLGTTATVGLLPAALGTHAVIASTVGFPISTGNWFADTASSKWLRPGTTLADASAATNSTSIFVFKTSFNFDPTVFNLGTASIVIKTASDNALSVYLNASSSALFGSGVINDVFAGFSASFTLTEATGLTAGENDLYFYSTNIPGGEPNPSGLRVELDPTVTRLTSAVPEPSTYALFASTGLALIIAFRTRRKRSLMTVL